MLLDFFIKKASEYKGIAAAKYKLTMEQANAEARAQAQAAAYQQAAANLNDDYNAIADLLIEAINNTVSATHLLPITHPSQLFSSPWLTRASDGTWILLFHARRETGFGLTADDVRRILQMELNRLCGCYDLPRIEIRVRFHAYGNVTIAVVPAKGVVI